MEVWYFSICGSSHLHHPACHHVSLRKPWEISPRLRLDPVASWKPITSEVPWREDFFWSRMKFREKVGTYLVVSWNGGTPSHHPNFILGFSLSKTVNFGGIPIGGNHHLEHGKHLGNLVETQLLYHGYLMANHLQMIPGRAMLPGRSLPGTVNPAVFLRWFALMFKQTNSGSLKIARFLQLKP